MASIVEKRLTDGSQAWLVRFRTADGTIDQRYRAFALLDMSVLTS
jgi:hypothetical protein